MTKLYNNIDSAYASSFVLSAIFRIGFVWVRPC